MLKIIVLEKPVHYASIDYDGLWKKLIIELFEEFVLFVTPDLYEEIDFKRTPDFLQQELYKEVMKEKKGKKIADQIVKVFLKDGQEQWILIHIEVQGDRDPDFSKRMFRYYYRIFDQYDRDIVAIALFTDSSNRFRPHMFQKSLFGTKLTYEYNVCKIMDHHETKLAQSKNPFAIGLLAGILANKSKKDNKKRYHFKRKLIKMILEKTDFPPKEQRIYVSTLIYFIDYLLQIPEDLTTKLRKEIKISKEEIDMMYLDRNNLPPTFGHWMRVEREEGRKEGRREGRREGIMEGRKAGKGEGELQAKKRLAYKLIQEQFADDYVAQLTELHLEEVKKLRDSVMN
jgi:predicted transposase YdaD